MTGDLVWLISMFALVFLAGIVLWISERVQTPTSLRPQMMQVLGSTFLDLTSKKAKSHAALKMANDGSLDFVLQDQSSSQRVTLSRLTDGPPLVEVTDKNGQRCVRVAFEANGSMVLSFLDKNGKEDTVLSFPIDRSNDPKFINKPVSSDQYPQEPNPQPLAAFYDRRGQVTWA